MIVIGWLAVLGGCGLLLWMDFSWVTVGMAVVLLLVWEWTSGIVMKIFDTVGAGALKLLSSCSSIFEFVIVYAVVVLGGLCAVFLWFGLLYLWFGEERLDRQDIPFVVRYASNWVVSFGIIWIFMFLDGLLTLAGAAVIAVARLVLSFFQVIVWRVRIPAKVNAIP